MAIEFFSEAQAISNLSSPISMRQGMNLTGLLMLGQDQCRPCQPSDLKEAFVRFDRRKGTGENNSTATVEERGMAGIDV